MSIFEYIQAGFGSVFMGPAAFHLFTVGVSMSVVMVFLGFVVGILVGATPGLAGPMAMAIALPILISIFGFTPDALLPVMGFLIGIMKGATVGGAVPAILFNTPGTPDAYCTTFDGYPMALKGQARRALRVAQISAASADTFSDLVLILTAPFLAAFVERYLDFPEKAALLILSMTFIASIVGASPAKGLIATALGLLCVFVGTGEDFHPRLSLGLDVLEQGIPATTAIIGVLVIGSVLESIEGLWLAKRENRKAETPRTGSGDGLQRGDIRRIAPFIARSAVIGTIIGALPGLGSTLAATLGYQSGRVYHARRKKEGDVDFGEGAPEGIASTEAATAAVSGANLIPVLSLGIPGNVAAVFLILAADTIGGFNPGPSVFRIPAVGVNPELVVAFALFTLMMTGNFLNWTIGGVFMRFVGILARIPAQRLLPAVLLLTLTAIYVQQPKMSSMWLAVGFGFLGYFMRKLGMTPLPFVIAFVLGERLEETSRQAFSATGSDPWFLFSSPVCVLFLVLSVLVVFYPSFTRRRARKSAA